jgi:RNA polymerase sigma-70 factor (ECF subfamily)
MAQRLVRVKRKIADAAIPYSVPPAETLAARLNAVLVTVYLIFTAGYTASSGDALIRTDLCGEAIRLGRLLVSLAPNQSEPAALLALMLFHDSRRATRTDAAGDIVLLEDQDRSRWNREAIDEAGGMLRRATANGAGATRYGIEAQIAALHAIARRPQDTDWARIVTLYAELKRAAPSPVVELNEAVAIAMLRGAEAGLDRLAELERSGRLADYHLLPAAQARLFEKLGDRQSAIIHYKCALALARNDPERRFLSARLAIVSFPSASC